MVGALGAEVDRLEQEVRLLVPGLRHIDLETDRGRRDGTASQVGLSSLLVSSYSDLAHSFCHFKWSHLLLQDDLDALRFDSVPAYTSGLPSNGLQASAGVA